jgi:hypothetical protein
VRILLSRAIEVDPGKAGEVVLVRVEPLMLAGENEPGRQPARRQRSRDGAQLDRFGSGADDQANVGRTQPSP